MIQKFDYVVVGGGAMGSATAWHLAKRGRSVLLLERFSPRHKFGSSHGTTRNFNVMYRDPVYLDMVTEAERLWRELESDSGVPLLDQVGIVNHGGAVGDESDIALMAAHGVAAELMPIEEASERWPGIRFDRHAMFSAAGGRVNAEESVVALQTQATRFGADVRFESPVQRISITASGAVEVVTDAETFLAEHCIVTLGAWTRKILGDTVPLPALTVTQEQPMHFAPLDATMTWPSFNHAPTPGDSAYDYWYSGVYGMLTPGEGIKAGWHGVGPVVDPDHRDFTSEPVQLDALKRYARDWLPGVDPESFTEISCMYTTTPDSNFVLDTHGPLTIGAGFSGHGFKFVPTVGRILADAAMGVARPDPMFTAIR